MRPALRWTLLATLGVTAASLWLEERPAPIVPAAAHRAGDTPPASWSVPAAAATPTAPLPARLQPVPAVASERDPFVPVSPPAPAPAPVLAVVPPPAPVMPPVPAPAAPPVKARFLGRMVTPDGQTLVFLAAGDTTVTAQAGDVLDDGYVVQSVTADAVLLIYPALDVKVSVPLPPAPDSTP